MRTCQWIFYFGGMKITERIIQITAVLLVVATVEIVGSSVAQSAPKPGCADVSVIQEFSSGLTGLNPTADPKGQSVKMKKSADKIKGLLKNAPKELKPDYAFLAKLMADLSTSFGKVDPKNPLTIAKGLDPLTKGTAELAQVGPHFTAYAAKNCK